MIERSQRFLSTKSLSGEHGPAEITYIATSGFEDDGSGTGAILRIMQKNVLRAPFSATGGTSIQSTRAVGPMNCSDDIGGLDRQERPGLSETESQNIAPINRATCEIRFVLKEDREWSDAWPNAIIQSLITDYPLTRMGLEFQVNVAAMQGAQAGGGIPSGTVWSCRTSDDSRSVEIRASKVNIACGQDYPGWPAYREEILRVWRSVNQEIEPASVCRIGMKYINVFERTDPETPLSHWLESTGYLPQELMRQHARYSSSVMMTRGDHDRFIVKVGEAAGQNEHGYNNVIFDIDYIVEEQMSSSPDELVTNLNRVHTGVHSIFDASVPKRIEHEKDENDD